MNDDDIKQAYEQSRQTYPAPGRIKRRVLQQSHRPVFWQRYLPGKEWMALGGALCCLLVLFVMQSLPHSAPLSDNDVLTVNVTYHGYENELPASHDYQQQLTVYNQQYLDKLLTLKAFHSKQARLAKREGNWLFTDCDNQAITVSPQLMRDLMLHERVDRELMAGIFVELIFDRQGRLIQIAKKPDNLC